MSGNWVPLDDTSPQLLYEGSWALINGSSRQWESAVHSTSEVGARCSLWFKGIGIALRATIPSGSASQVFNYSIDEQSIPSLSTSPLVSSPTRISTPQGPTTNFSVELLRVEDLPEAIYRLTLTNIGPAPFQLDFIEYWPGEGDPTPEPIFPPTETTPGTDTAPSASATESVSSSGGSLSTGAIAGIAVGGAVVLIALAVLFFLLRKRRKRKVNSKGGGGDLTSGNGRHPAESSITPFTVQSPASPFDTITSGPVGSPGVLARKGEMVQRSDVPPSSTTSNLDSGRTITNVDSGLTITTTDIADPPPEYKDVFHK